MKVFVPFLTLQATNRLAPCLVIRACNSLDCTMELLNMIEYLVYYNFVGGICFYIILTCFIQTLRNTSQQALVHISGLDKDRFKCASSDLSTVS